MHHFLILALVYCSVVSARTLFLIRPRSLRRVHSLENVFGVLKSLPRDCYTLEKAPYVYEYCHMESVRQTFDHLDGGMRQEWDLGHYSPEESIQAYCPRHKVAKITLTGGTDCPEAHYKRHTKVKFLCTNPNLSMHIVDVKEKSTCNYRVYVHVPEMCFKR